MGTHGGEEREAPAERSRAGPWLGRDAMLLLLTWAAGSTDAISYLGLGHVFTAMMTGNTVFLGLALGQGQVLAALRSVLALAGFALGVALGALIVERRPRLADWPAAVTGALALEGGLLGLFTAIWHLSGPARGAGPVHALIALSALAMGLQSAAVRALGVPGIATTYITGTLTSLMVALVHRLQAAARPAAPDDAGQRGAADATAPARWELRVRLLGGVFLVYGLGALVGGLLLARGSALSTASPLLAVAVVVGNALVGHRRR